jgi:uncharacterized protein
MNRLRISFILLITNFLIAYSQDTINPYNAEKIIRQGVEFHDKGEYSKALDLYNKVNRNDSSYGWALAEKSVTLLKMKRYEEVIKICQLAVTNEKIHEPFIYINLGTAFDELGKKEESLKAFDEGIRFFPMNHLLYFNKAITLQRSERYLEAIDNYQKTLWINPNHRNSHLRLGYLCANEGKYTQAILSLCIAVLLSPSDTTSLEIISYLNKFVSQKNALTSKKVVLSQGDDFAGLDMIIGNQLALNPKYKLKNKIDFPIVRQMEVLLDNLTYNLNDNGFWMQFYVPTFAEIMKTERSEAFIYNLLLSSTNKDIAKIISKNISKIKNFIEWGGDFWNKSHPYMVLPDGNKSSVSRTTNKVEAVGNKEAGKHIGLWRYYDSSGNMISTGAYKDGLRDGNWLFYHSNGQKSGDINFTRDIPDGIYNEYNTSGQLAKKTYYHDSVPEIEIAFYPSGDTLSITQYKKGLQEGLYKTFHPIRTKEFEIPYSQGKISGIGKKYFDTGIPEIEVEFKNDEKSGFFKEYYKNGKMYNSESYVNNKSEGPVKYFFANGAIKVEANAHGGKYVNDYKIFYHNGKLMDYYLYNEAGKLNGTYKHNDQDGVLHYEIDYVNDNPVAVRYFNKKGAVIFESKKNKNILAYKEFYPNGRLASQGMYQDNKKMGNWKYYDIHGILTQEENYSEGELNGPFTFYFKNGKIDRKFKYSSGKPDGPYIEYYANDSLYAKGYYVKGQLAGSLETYEPDGLINLREYYLNGEKHGWQEIFTTEGKINYEVLMGNGKLLKGIQYDTLGNGIEVIDLKGGTGAYVSHHQNHQIKYKSEYINGFQHGKCYLYNALGNLDDEGAYYSNEQHGYWKWYNDDKALITEGYYNYGNADSTWREFYPNKQAKSEKTFVDGTKNGAYKEYFDNGKIKQKGNYLENKKIGTFEYFNDQGELMYVIYYYEDDILGLSYSKGGKLIDTIYLDKGNGRITTYYDNGKKSMECQYQNGWLQGKKTCWYSNGNPFSEINFLNNTFNGPSKIYYADGTLKSDENYFWGRLNGLCNYFYPNGKTSKSLPYRMDKLHGVSRYYNQDGKILKENYYYNGNAYNEKTKF